MKVHLVRTVDFKEDDFENVLNLLQAFPGAIEFKSGGTMDLDSPGGYKIFANKTKFEYQEQVYYKKSEFHTEEASVYRKISFPFRKKYYSWESLFEAIENHKKQQQLLPNDFVFLLTNQYNEKNWFAFLGPSMRIGFIHTDNWPWFFGDGADIRYPISYEVTTWIMRALMFNGQREVIEGFHKKTVGCVNDFCKNKNEITIKMRTADVCDECMQVIKNKDIKPHYLNQLFSIMDGIRSNLMFRKRISILNKDSRIKIDLTEKKIFLTDFGSLDVRLNPKELSLYLLFLNHTNGIALNSLNEHHAELLLTYQKISGRLNITEMSSTISLLTDYLDGELSTTISRIKSKFKKALGEEMCQNYFIQLLPTGVHGIPLNREGVVVS